MSTSRFDVSWLLTDLGESITLYDITDQDLDAWGDEGTLTTSAKTITAVVQEIEAEDAEIAAGIASPKDIRVFIDDSVSTDFVDENNQIIRASDTSTTYRIIQVTKNQGHFEVVAKRE